MMVINLAKLRTQCVNILKKKRKCKLDNKLCVKMPGVQLYRLKIKTIWATSSCHDNNKYSDVTSSPHQDQGIMAVKIKEKILKMKSNIRDYKPHKVLQTPPLARTASTYVISTNKTSKNVPNTPHKILYPMKVNPEKANCKIHQRTIMKSNLGHHMKTAHSTSNNYKYQNCEKIFTTKYSWPRHA